jgi:hypothetical protein
MYDLAYYIPVVTMLSMVIGSIVKGCSLRLNSQATLDWQQVTAIFTVIYQDSIF